ncbi:hypothetical protein ACIA5A_05965 [Micromonospora sp. NPDC051300]|uniref:hypothetical protein n=1 Tax=Micromonospora sp. NPDC051300 TaxID=3364286 RepID=UPI00379EB3D0
MPEGTEAAPVVEQPPEGEPKTFDADYVEKLRKENAKYRTEAKVNADAARRLAEIEEANKSEAERSAERLAKAEQTAREAEARAVRREVALEHTLTKDDAALLDAITDEDAMRRLAERLAAGAGSRRSNHVPREGTSTSSGGSDERELARSLFAGD